MVKNDNSLNGFTSNLQADINENQALIEAYNLIERGEFLKAEDVLTKQLEKLNSAAYVTCIDGSAKIEVENEYD